ncbi:MAG: glutamate--tRNA ligase, partial [Actinobacteria bacterium]|nr:glutamate--tRNA ligase [Actinomycetota bacterium]
MTEEERSHPVQGEIRVRIAPSPTGPIHVGTMHTALFNWLFARGNGGKFILRLEDTDQKRSRKEWEDVIYSEMKWLGFDWDEGPDVGGPYGPYRQMERLDLYRKYAQQLLETGHAYYCYCTPEELEAERAEAQHKGLTYQYSRRCRCLTAEQRRDFEAQGRKQAIRFKVPDEEIVAFDDLIRGRIENPTDSLGDFIIVRPNGLPLYNFAVVIDDVTMKITHVIRGEDHISNTPVPVLLYQ